MVSQNVPAEMSLERESTKTIEMVQGFYNPLAPDLKVGENERLNFDTVSKSMGFGN